MFTYKEINTLISIIYGVLYEDEKNLKDKELDETIKESIKERIETLKKLNIKFQNAQIYFPTVIGELPH